MGNRIVRATALGMALGLIGSHLGMSALQVLLISMLLTTFVFWGRE